MRYDWFNKVMHQDLDQSEHSEKETAYRLNRVQNSRAFWRLHGFAYLILYQSMFFLERRQFYFEYN